MPQCSTQPGPKSVADGKPLSALLTELTEAKEAAIAGGTTGYPGGTLKGLAGRVWIKQDD